jgi:proline dehydrogenase
LLRSSPAKRLPDLIPRLDANGDGLIDYIEWSKLLKPQDLPRLVENCVNKHGPLSVACPNPEELELMIRMRARLFDIAECAAEHNVRLLIDAEQTYYQPAIDNLTISLMKTFNTGDIPVIFNTYQCYLKDAATRVEIDLDRAQRNNYRFAAKLVRGAYMVAERQRAKDMGYESPIQDTIEDTHNCYNNLTRKLIKNQHIDKSGGEVMVASHNKESIEKAVELLQELGVGKEESGVHFAQLLGMRDDLSFNLGNAGYSAMKYVPYGKVEEVLPYLIRRAQENSDITAGMGQEIIMIEKELKRRVGISSSSS